MIRLTRLFIAATLIFYGFIFPSFAEKRIALVIGNSNYTKLQSLTNPGNDAKLMSKTLSKLGFEVISAIDADRIAMARAMRKFGQTLRAGGRDAVGLFYYAGHGVQARGTNYLIPLNADIEGEDDLDIEAVSASNVLSRMETAGNALNLVILDACRNNPYKGVMRASSRGLVRVQAASGSLVAFSAAPGQVASDGNGENSPYTTSLVEAMQVPGLTVEQMFKRVRVSVETLTSRRQTPWEESSLRGDFYFVPGKLKSANNALAVLQPVPQRKIDPKAIELSFWDSIQKSNNIELFEEYFRRYPNGEFAIIAKAKLESLNKTKEKQREIKVANLPQNPSLDTGGNQRRITIILQKQLKRVGCYRGGIDGQWGRGSAAAVIRFNKFAKTNLPSKEPSKSSIGEVIAQKSRVCPLVCRSGYKQKNGKCVRAIAAKSKSISNNKSTNQRRPPRGKGGCRAGILKACIRACQRGYQRACRKARFLGG